MAKVVDITDKLSFDENPKIVIKGELFEVNADARTMLEIMGLFSSKGQGEAALEAFDKMFSEKDRKRIDEMNLPFKDFMKLIEIAMDLISGEEESGEQ
ncbi:MAG: hypothetical protein J6K26_09335 [Lachnospiraceae bacterium]|nr:hypothetical protein [Lachnospiraceae bacterium]